MTPEEHAQLTEILRDAESCARLSDWEERFVDELRDRVLISKQDTRVSEKQWVAIRKIEEKVYAS